MTRFTWALALTTLIFSMPSYGFILSERWTNTATDGGGLQFGDPTTITWSIIPDGTNISGEGPSDFIAVMDTIIGAGPGGSDLTQRPWFTLLEQSFGRWEELGGITHVYEPNDIGGSSPGSNGVLGSRGDVRIGGVFQDGNSGVLAFNFFPNSGGDMVLDTGDTNIISNSNNNFRAFRNIIMHEHGHGIGISHIESSNANFLMEPFLATSFDGPQLDDIRALHRGYGDKFEKENNGNGNDTIGNAIALGSPASGSPLVIGTAGNQTAVPATETDFVSIDQNTDTDFFSFNVASSGEVMINLQPQGATFNQGAQGGNQSAFNTRTVSDLTLAFFDQNQSLVTVANVTDEGGSENISASLDVAGDYYVRITGTANNIQFYQLSIDFDGVATPSVDFDGNGTVGCDDVDALVAAIVAATNDTTFDLTGDGVVNTADLDLWLVDAGAINNASGGAYLSGDANLDGVVDVLDFNQWNANKFQAEPAWCSGDFTADGVVDVLDFNRWNANKFQSSDAAAVPEPSMTLLLMLGAVAMLASRRAGSVGISIDSKH